MGTTERKEREKLELKDQILFAAKQIMAAEGQEKLSIRKIAALIEYSPGTIYLYFKDKDEIIFELTQMGFQLLTQTMHENLKITDPLLRLRTIGADYIHFGLTNPDWYELMFNSHQPIKHLERCQAEWRDGYQLFETLVATSQEIITTYSLTSLNPRVLALMLWSTVHGLVNLAQSQRLEMVEKNAASMLIEQTLDTILASFIHSKN